MKFPLNQITQWGAALAVTLTIFCGCQNPDITNRTAPQDFTFSIAADIREFTGPAHPGPRYFEGACAALQSIGPGDFMISPGDIDPPASVRGTLDRYFGTNFVWYPAVGNHEAETAADMAWLRNWGAQSSPGLVRRGPVGTETTTFSFDHGSAHFVVLNHYYDGRSDVGCKGDMVDALYDWLRQDLEANRKPAVFVIGHEPIQPSPDLENGRLRHKGDSLDAHPENAARFLALMRQHRVIAYLTAHTHTTSVVDLGGVWQVDCGHARGMGDRGSRSTFLRIQVRGGGASLEIHRDDGKGGPYALVKSMALR